MSNIAFHFFLCALTKFRLLTKTDPRVFLCGYEYTSQPIPFFSFNKDEFNNNYRTFSMFTELAESFATSDLNCLKEIYSLQKQMATTEIFRSVDII